MSLWTGVCSSSPLAVALILPAPAIDDLADLLEPIRKEHDLPALGPVAVVDGELQALAAAGLRKHGGKQAVTTADKWHIDSCTKSMTATLAASLVEEGRLSWDSTISEVLHSIAQGNDHYACGWVVMKRPWAKGPALTHNGSNTMNYCVIWFAPKRKFAAVAIANAGGSAKACDEAVAGLVRKHLE